MKFGKLLGMVLALGLVCCGAAQAQLSVYGMYQANRFTGLTCLDPQNQCSGTNSNSEGQLTSTDRSSHVNTTGGWGGVTYDFRNFGPMRLGIDLRGGESHSDKSATSYAGGNNQTSSQAGLIGLKGTFHTPIRILKPYAQISVGMQHTNVAEPAATTDLNGSMPRQYDNYIAYEGIIGLDIKIFPILDLRLPELGIGNMNTVGSTGPVVSNSVGLKSVGLGIVFHLPAS